MADLGTALSNLWNWVTQTLGQPISDEIYKATGADFGGGTILIIIAIVLAIIWAMVESNKK